MLKKGDYHILTIRLETANEKYVANESSTMHDMLELFKEIIFAPHRTGEKAFDKKIFNREKQTLKQKMAAITDDKMSYANMRLIDEMCKDETYKLHVHGYESQLNELTSEETYSYYKEVLEQDQLDLYVVGDVEMSEIEQFFLDNFSRHPVPQREAAADEKPRMEKINEVIEKQQIQQAKLHIGYRTQIVFADADYPALHVFNGLLGGFPSSKLFLNVREKNSLAYYAASRMESHKGLLFIFSGIAPADYTKARQIIEEQMTAMKKGDFTDDEMDKTKELIINQLLETMDNPVGLVELSYQQVVAGATLPPERLIHAIQVVTKEQIIAVAEKIHEDTVYLLTDKGGA
ncbi:pitrilysin family protein [Virgibacillus halophilus]|uniref:Pitrilysin family protein n=1 Tax=Tigheibacillus halophilus TaxID=361280 RepID=A0ABU5CAS2_9BACI|nr:pitrilysin family protein [Virgibacillus halophilus]